MNTKFEEAHQLYFYFSLLYFFLFDIIFNVILSILVIEQDWYETLGSVTL